MSKSRDLKCSNCAHALRALTLEGHYQRMVEIDVCDPCCLIWFGEVESVRLAGAGITGLIRTIHGAMSDGQPHPQAVSLARVQTCPICGSVLEQVQNVSRFGRTSQLQCPSGHGYYQTFILYLAEKGFIRPIAWSDISGLARDGQQFYCANCGAGLEARPQQACPYCQSALGVLDPARLASAIDPGTTEGQVKREQSRCLQCGGPLDATSHARCPHCSAVIRRQDTAAALQVSEAAQAKAQHKAEQRRLAREQTKARIASRNAEGDNQDGGQRDWRRTLELCGAFGLLAVFLLLLVFSRMS